MSIKPGDPGYIPVYQQLRDGTLTEDVIDNIDISDQTPEQIRIRIARLKYVESTLDKMIEELKWIKHNC